MSKTQFEPGMKVQISRKNYTLQDGENTTASRYMYTEKN